MTTCNARRDHYACVLEDEHQGPHVDPTAEATWHSTELCGETNPPDRCKSLYSVDGDQMQCERPKDHPAWHSAIGVVWEGSAPAPTCSAVLHLHADHACILPQGHSERHKDADGGTWDITWTRPQSARMEVPAPPLTFSRDKRLRALEEFQDSAGSRLDALEKGTVHVTATLKSVGDRFRETDGRLDALEKWTARPAPEGLNAHEFSRIMGRVTATLDSVGTRLIGRGPDRSSEVVAKLGEILERLGPPEPPRCGIVRPYSGSHGRSGKPNPDDLCVKEKGHTGRHVNGTATWPNPDDLCVSDRCEVKHPETGHPCWKVVGPNMQPHTAHRTAYGSVWESERTHDADCERGPDHTDECCCSHPNGVGPNGCAGCGDYRQD